MKVLQELTIFLLYYPAVTFLGAADPKETSTVVPKKACIRNVHRGKKKKKQNWGWGWGR